MLRATDAVINDRGSGYIAPRGAPPWAERTGQMVSNFIDPTPAVGLPAEQVEHHDHSVRFCTFPTGPPRSSVLARRLSGSSQR